MVKREKQSFWQDAEVKTLSISAKMATYVVKFTVFRALSAIGSRFAGRIEN